MTVIEMAKQRLDNCKSIDAAINLFETEKAEGSGQRRPRSHRSQQWAGGY
jgi:hypothetical protein